MAQTFDPNATLSTERVIPATPAEVFAAFARADLLAQWWGPDDFTCTFDLFDFALDGRWVFVLHGPDGADYANENIFREIVPNARIRLEHVVGHWFMLTLTLTPRGDQTHLVWSQEFESPEEVARIRSVVEPANEQNLDRLQTVIARARR